MMKTAKTALILVLAMGLASTAFGHASYVGYSGAPGSSGRCASSCHGSPGGTIEISGFPESYMPGQEYEITISHAGGSTIRQFNGSCRVGTGSENAGVISSGTNTVTYNNSHETNGIHFSAASMDNGTFNWTAPSAGTGDVRLYIAGLQGGHSGQNSTLALLSSEQTTGIADRDLNMPGEISLSQNYPNPFNARTTIEFSLIEPSEIELVIYDLLGNKVQTILDAPMSSGTHLIAFDASELSSGVYFYRLESGETAVTKRMILLK